MSTQVGGSTVTTTSITGLHSKTFEAPDETLPGAKASMTLVDVGGVRAWKIVFEPGWRYTEHVEPDLCSAPHAAYIAAGRLGIRMEDGTESEVGPGSVVVIGPGHDAWTVGDEECVFIDFGEAVAG